MLFSQMLGASAATRPNLSILDKQSCTQNRWTFNRVKIRASLGAQSCFLGIL